MKINKIVLVDDEPISNYINRSVLKLYDASYEITEFTSAALALDYFKSNVADLVFVDLNMPEMSGFDFLSAMETMGCNIPTIVLTSSVSKADQKQVAEFSNVTRYELKPLDLKIVIDFMSKGQTANG